MLTSVSITAPNSMTSASLTGSEMFSPSEALTWSTLDRESVSALQRILADKRWLAAPDVIEAVASALRASCADAAEPALIAALLGDFDPSIVSDAGLLILAASSVVDPSWSGQGDIDPDDLIAISALDTADWLQIVVNGAKRGAGQYFSAEDFFDWIEDDLVTDDVNAVERGLAWLDSMWRSIGLIDNEDRLTAVGEWVLPRALCHAWGASFD